MPQFSKCDLPLPPGRFLATRPSLLRILGKILTPSGAVPSDVGSAIPVCGQLRGRIPGKPGAVVTAYARARGLRARLYKHGWPAGAAGLY